MIPADMSGSICALAFSRFRPIVFQSYCRDTAHLCPTFVVLIVLDKTEHLHAIDLIYVLASLPRVLMTTSPTTHTSAHTPSLYEPLLVRHPFFA